MKKLLNYLFDLIPMIKKDKLGHFFGGTFIAYIIILLPINPIYCIIGTTVIAVAKELYDDLVRKTFFSVPDVIFTIIPSVLFYTVRLIKGFHLMP